MTGGQQTGKIPKEYTIETAIKKHMLTYLPSIEFIWNLRRRFDRINSSHDVKIPFARSKSSYPSDVLEEILCDGVGPMENTDFKLRHTDSPVSFRLTEIAMMYSIQWVNNF
ncbi:hypothetical protein M514_25391 [Trichuris suis]|uniref:Uncharacterized protein n=1 Tax=Trichuris suis TaxID=68888 RepID=A0A085MZ12_9BILA|nr:hypothetical protein M514_25391 [Trichuris suis]